MLLYAASNNAHKISELILAFQNCEIRSPAEAGINFEFEETEDSFTANSLAKAMALWKLIGKPVLADDSGLCVDALGGRPGVYSARYGSVDGKTPLGSSERNRLLLKEMEGKSLRSCRFVCSLSLLISPYRFFVIQETLEGQLLYEPIGKGGFGYDPIVFLPELGKSVAELEAAEKNKLSHRGKAVLKMAEIIGTFKTANGLC